VAACVSQGTGVQLTLVGVALLVVGGLTTWRLVHRGRPYREGPWPGLSPVGAQLLLGCALLLGGGQLILGNPRTPLPELPLLSVLALAPLALAMHLVGAPGAASAVCGAYLLPRTLLSLIDASIDPPPLLLVPALAFDLSAWLRASDVANLANVWPHKQSLRKKRGRQPRRLRPWRLAIAGGVFGGVLAAVEPPFALLLGADPATWSGTPLVLASTWSVIGCVSVGLGLALALSARGTAR
jgi:hypothetical protein